MLESYVGEEKFRQGINRYLQAHANANATARDFWNAIAVVSGKPADKVMSSFVANPGIPIISADINCGQSEVTLHQQRFFLNSQASTGNNEMWTMPVCLAGVSASDGKPQCELLTRKEQTFKLDHCPAAAFLNAGGRGYYRSAYSSQAMSSLMPKVETALTPVERLALVDNEWALVRAGSHPISVFLSLAEGLKSDRTGAVISEVSRHLQYVTDHLLTAEDRGAYEAWVRALLQPAIRELGWTPTPGDNEERRQLRATVFYTLGYSGNDPEAFAQADSLLNKYRQDPASVDPTLLTAVFSLSALHGTPELYDQFLNGTRSAKSPEEYYRYLSAMTDFSDPALLQRTLDFVLSPSVRSQDTPHLIAGVLSNPAGQDIAWKFVQAHWSELHKKTSYFGGSAIVHATAVFCSPEKREQVQQFFTEHPAPEAQRSLKQSEEQIGYCIQTKQMQQPALNRWLQQQKRAASN
jgi:aminopeptidase N/puromycin-sensitive aminopeptidase